eukprot:SAG31_NODE_12467_length_939_cov_2.242857_1_plen_103_part_10
MGMRNETDSSVRSKHSLAVVAVLGTEIGRTAAEPVGNRPRHARRVASLAKRQHRLKKARGLTGRIEPWPKEQRVPAIELLGRLRHVHLAAEFRDPSSFRCSPA